MEGKENFVFSFPRLKEPMEVESAGVSTLDAPATEGAATSATNGSTDNVVSEQPSASVEQPSAEQREEPNMQAVAENVEVIVHCAH